MDDALHRGEAYRKAAADWRALEQELFTVIELEKLLAVERATVEKRAAED